MSVPNNAVLLVTLSGQVVEEDDFDGQGTFSSMVDGSDSFTRLRDVTRALSLAAEDKRIAAVHFRVQDLQKAGLASLREIGAAMDRVKAAGKKSPFGRQATARFSMRLPRTPTRSLFTLWAV